MLIYAVFLLSIAIGTTGGALVYGPTDQNVTVGQQVILLCATDLDLPVYWYFKGNEIFYGGKVAMAFQDRYNVFSNKTGEYNLVIPSADVSYNGEYICGDDEGEGQRKSALLYVTAETVTVAETKGSTSNDGVNLGLIIGIVVGIVLCIAILIITVYCCKKSANKKEKKPSGNAEAGEKLLDKDSGAKEAAKSNIYGTPHRTDPAPAAGNKGAPKLNEGKSWTTEVPKKDENNLPLRAKTASGATEAVNSNIDTTATPKVADLVKRIHEKENKQQPEVDLHCHYEDPKNQSKSPATHEDSEPESDNVHPDATEVPPSTNTTSQLELEQKTTDELEAKAAPMAEAKSRNDSQATVLHTPKYDILTETSQIRYTSKVAPRQALTPGNDPPPATSGTTDAQPKRALGNTAMIEHSITTLPTDDEKLVDDPQSGNVQMSRDGQPATTESAPIRLGAHDQE